jgi:hypothetical protein
MGEIRELTDDELDRVNGGALDIAREKRQVRTHAKKGVVIPPQT